MSLLSPCQLMPITCQRITGNLPKVCKTLGLCLSSAASAGNTRGAVLASADAKVAKVFTQEFALSKTKKASYATLEVKRQRKAQ
jgi:hypothetical protein